MICGGGRVLLGSGGSQSSTSASATASASRWWTEASSLQHQMMPNHRNHHRIWCVGLEVGWLVCELVCGRAAYGRVACGGTACERFAYCCYSWFMCKLGAMGSVACNIALAAVGVRAICGPRQAGAVTVMCHSSAALKSASSEFFYCCRWSAAAAYCILIVLMIVFVAAVVSCCCDRTWLFVIAETLEMNIALLQKSAFLINSMDKISYKMTGKDPWHPVKITM